MFENCLGDGMARSCDSCNVCEVHGREGER